MGASSWSPCKVGRAHRYLDFAKAQPVTSFFELNCRKLKEKRPRVHICSSTYTPPLKRHEVPFFCIVFWLNISQVMTRCQMRVISEPNTEFCPGIQGREVTMKDKQPKNNNPRSPQFSAKIKIARLIRSHWKSLAVAFIAVLGETFADVLEPWPIKVVVDNILQSKHLPAWLGGTIAHFFGTNKPRNPEFRSGCGGGDCHSGCSQLLR
jgi:hypothetical protein